jgi:tetratricopeptide (TPR) repeat protein
MMAWHAGELDAAESHLRQAVHLLEGLGPEQGPRLAQLRINLALTARDRGDPLAAERLFVEARQLASECGRGDIVAQALINAAVADEERGELASAVERLRECMPALEQSEELVEFLDEARYVRGFIAVRRGDLDAARADLAAALRGCVERGALTKLAPRLRAIASYAAARGDDISAATLRAGADAHERRLSAPTHSPDRPDDPGSEARLRARLGAAGTFTEAARRGEEMSITELIDLANRTVTLLRDRVFAPPFSQPGVGKI